MKCWGNNEDGQIGDGSTTNRLTPVDVLGLTSGVTAIAVGGSHSCALTAGGSVLCWGGNDHGSLGNNSQVPSPVPVAVAGLTSGVTAIAAGFFHTCAVLAGGSLKCWGNGTNGEVGDNGWTDRLTPVNVVGLGSGVSAVSVNGHFSGAVVSGGAKCWGENDDGQIGDNTTTDRGVPTNVSGLNSGVAAIGLGYFHTCAVLTGGGLKCWGHNNCGELGDGTRTDRPTPVNVTGLSSGVAVVGAVSATRAPAWWTGGSSVGDRTTTVNWAITPRSAAWSQSMSSSILPPR